MSEKSKEAGKKNLEKHHFKKGQSGNPKGKRPGAQNHKTVAKNVLGKAYDEAKDKGINNVDEFVGFLMDKLNHRPKDKAGQILEKTLNELIAERLAYSAIHESDNVAAFGLWDRAFGRPTQRTENETKITETQKVYLPLKDGEDE